MDVRVFPFSFPPIKGGAQGGISPTPTPEPALPYNVDAVSISLTLANDKWNTGTTVAHDNAAFSVSGMIAENVADVASITFDYSGLVWTADGSDVVNTYATQFYSTSNAALIADPSGITGVKFYAACDVSNGGKDAAVSGDVAVSVYDSNGEVIQTFDVTVVVS